MKTYKFFWHALLFTSHITPHTTLGNEKCLKILLGVCNTKERGDLSISLSKNEEGRGVGGRWSASSKRQQKKGLLFPLLYNAIIAEDLDPGLHCSCRGSVSYIFVSEYSNMTLLPVKKFV
jgi:hypothetical protein